MRHGWMALGVVWGVFVCGAAVAHAQAPASGSRLKFTAPKSSVAAEARPTASDSPPASVPLAATAPSGPSSLTFRAPRTTWNEPGALKPLAGESAEWESRAAAARAGGARVSEPYMLPSRLTDLPPEESLADGEAPDEVEMPLPARRSDSRRSRSVATRDSRVVPAGNRMPYDLDDVEGLQTQAQIDLNDNDSGPMPRPDTLPDDGWFQPDQGDEPWVGDECWQGCPMPMRRRDRLWVRADYLAGFLGGMSLPPMVTTSPAGTPRAVRFADVAAVPTLNNTIIPVAGVLGFPTTTVRFGGRKYNYGYRPGGRVVVGGWLTRSRLLGLELEYLALADKESNYSATGNGTSSQIIMRPFSDTSLLINARNAEVVSFPPGPLDTSPPGAAGTVTVDAYSRFQSGGARFLINYGCDDGCPDFYGRCGRPVFVDCAWLVGYRLLRLDEGVNVQEILTILPPPPGSAPAGVIVVNDSFGVQNTFNGGETGLVTNVSRGRWTYGLTTKVALGNTQSVQTINGSTFNSTTDPAFKTGGLLAQPSNIGTYTLNRFSTVPEIGLSAGYAITPRLRWNFGYTFMYWSNVMRGGDQIDLNVNGNYLMQPVTNVDGRQAPLFTPHYGNLTVHLLNTGLEAHF